MCSAQYGCFLQFFNFVLSRHVPQVLSDFETVPLAPAITGSTLLLTFHVR